MEEAKMKKARIMSTPDDFKKLGVNPHKIENWEDGKRDVPDAGHSEVWYIDCSFDDNSTLVLAVRAKALHQMNNPFDSPNIAINYSGANGKPYYDFRSYDASEVSLSKEKCDNKLGPNTFYGENWRVYDFHIEAEPDKEVFMDQKTSIKHQTKVDLHFEAMTEPFRPGTGYISFGENDEYYYNFICITKLSVSGEISIDGETKTVQGFAYYNHQWFNISPINAFHHWLWGRTNEGKYGVLIYDMVSAEQFSLEQIPLFTIDDDNGHRVFESTSAENTTVKVLDSYIQEETGKEYPKTICYTFAKDDMEVEYTISKPEEIHVFNVYGDSPELVKKQFDQLNLQPTYTRYRAKTSLKILKNGKTETTTAPMLYEFNYPGKHNKSAHLF
jgi:hypothetical protein